MADYLLDKHLSSIALNAGKLVQTQTTLSSDQLTKKREKFTLWGQKPVCGGLAGFEPASAF
jgi:hypothetical protein